MPKSLFKQRGIDRENGGFDPGSGKSDPMDMVFHYHSETKHNFGRYARSLGYLDWANQPDPFRRFEGALLLKLPFMTTDDTPPYEWIFEAGRIIPKTVSLQSVAQFFEHSMALSAWKEF